MGDMCARLPSLLANGVASDAPASALPRGAFILRICRWIVRRNARLHTGAQRTSLHVNTNDRSRSGSPHAAQVNAALLLKRTFTTSDDLQRTEGNVKRMDEYTNIDELFRSGPAELYSHTQWRSMAYRRFETVASAIRFSMEELPLRVLIGTILEVEDERFDHKAIRSLYENDLYPLGRVNLKQNEAAQSGLPI